MKLPPLLTSAEREQQAKRETVGLVALVVIGFALLMIIL